MRLWDYHTHNELCRHAKGNIEEYILSAIEKDLDEIGLSDHFPMHLISKTADVEQYAMTIEEFPSYIQQCKQMREKYKNQIVVKIGSEVDYTSNSFSFYKKEINPFLDDLDYIIGSVHVMDIPMLGEKPIDGPNNPSLINEVGVDQFYELYYKNSSEMVKTHFYNIVGHCELPKKFGVVQTNKTWEFVLDFLDEVVKSDMAIEINQSGLSKPIKEQYPQEKIIAEMISRKIPITFGSDSHYPKDIAYFFPELFIKLQKMATTLHEPLYLAKFSNREITRIKI